MSKVNMNHISKNDSNEQARFLGLSDYNGYLCQIELLKLKDCYDLELFPHLLMRLSDYVPINRQLAAEHILRWSTKENFSHLCVDYFIEIAATQNRIRIDERAEEILLQKTVENIDYIKKVMLNFQGELPRTLLVYAKKYQWFKLDELIRICTVARDQYVRGFWLDHIIEINNVAVLKYELTTSQFKDVQLKLLHVLYKQQELELNEMILMWHSPYIAVIDYAYYLLKQKGFDFAHYFEKHPILKPNIQQSKVRVRQFILMKWLKADFFNLLKEIVNKELVLSYLLMALKRKYINLDEYFKFLEHSQYDLSHLTMHKLSGVIQRKLTVVEAVNFLFLQSKPMSLEQLLEFRNCLNFWDSLYWFIYIEKFIQTNQDFVQIQDHLNSLLSDAKYQNFAPSWQTERAQKILFSLKSKSSQGFLKMSQKDLAHLLKLIEKRI